MYRLLLIVLLSVFVFGVGQPVQVCKEWRYKKASDSEWKNFKETSHFTHIIDIYNEQLTVLDNVPYFFNSVSDESRLYKSSKDELLSLLVARDRKRVYMWMNEEVSVLLKCKISSAGDINEVKPAVLNKRNSYIELVKNGLFNFNKTLTVGEAFDNWSNCEKPEWESFETDNKIKVVQFTCRVKGIKEFTEKAKSITKTNKELIPICIDSYTHIFQFTINKDDTFQLDNIQSATVWCDGKKFSESLKKKDLIESVYANNKFIDINNLDKMMKVLALNFGVKRFGAMAAEDIEKILTNQKP